MLNEIKIFPTLALYALYFLPTLAFFYFYSQTKGEVRYYAKRAANPFFNLQMEGLRGVLSFSVFIHHCIISFMYYKTGIWTAPATFFYDKLGSCPVILFFFLTGYLFFEDSMRARVLQTKYIAFLESRFRRIYPAYVVSICFVVFFILLKSDFILLDNKLSFLKSLLSWIVVGLPNGIFRDINQYSYSTVVNAGVMWSLRYEIIFYFLCPIFIIWYAKNKNSLWWILLFCLIIFATRSYGLQILYDFSKFMILGFAGGILAAIYRHKINKYFIQKNVPWVIIALSIVLVSISEKYSVLESLGLLGLFLLVIYEFRPLKFLANPVFVSLGRVSYSFYLFHGIVIYVFFNYAFLPNTSLSQALTVACLGVLVSIVSIFSFRLVEQRFYRLQ